jgi:pimeloyl-ACP methyl ester carboxylesterase
MSTWAIVHSRHWKAQVPYLSRHFRVVTYDGRGNGRSDRPTTAEAYASTEQVGDALAVLDATGTERAVIVGLSCGALFSLEFAATHPERVLGVVALGVSAPLGQSHPERTVHPFDERSDTDQGWAKYNAEYWRREYPDFVDFFMGRIFTEPHSTKQTEDMIGWALEDYEPGVRGEICRPTTPRADGDASERVLRKTEPAVAHLVGDARRIAYEL